MHDGITATYFLRTSIKRAVIPYFIFNWFKNKYYSGFFLFLSNSLQFPQWLWIIYISQWHLHIFAWPDYWMDTRYYTKLCHLFQLSFNNVEFMCNFMDNWIYLATNSFAKEINELLLKIISMIWFSVIVKCEF